MSSTTVCATALRDLRLASARLAVLDRYDQRRVLAGHDYGAGQRARELTRRRLELEQLGRVNPHVGVNHGLVRWGMPELETAGYTAAEVEGAVRLELEPRLKRARREIERRWPGARGRAATAATVRALESVRVDVLAQAARERDTSR